MTEMFVSGTEVFSGTNDGGLTCMSFTASEKIVMRRNIDLGLSFDRWMT